MNSVISHQIEHSETRKADQTKETRAHSRARIMVEKHVDANEQSDERRTTAVIKESSPGKKIVETHAHLETHPEKSVARHTSPGSKIRSANEYPTTSEERTDRQGIQERVGAPGEEKQKEPSVHGKSQKHLTHAPAFDEVHTQDATHWHRHQRIKAHAKTERNRQTLAQPAGERDTTRLVLERCIERWQRRAEFERRSLYLSLHGDAEILREQIAPLERVCAQVGDMLRDYPDLSLEITIDPTGVTFFPTSDNPSSRVEAVQVMLGQLSSLEITQPLGLRHALSFKRKD